MRKGFFGYDKQVRTWGDATLASCVYLAEGPQEPDNILKQFVTLKGSKYWIALLYMTLYYGLILVGMFLSARFAVKRKSDAKKWLNEYELKKSESLSMKFSDYVDVYLEDLKPRLRKTTYETKRTYLRVHITPFFSNYGLDDISVSMVRKWQNQLIERGYSETYQKTLNNQLSALFNHAVAYYGLKNNPVRIAGPIGKEHGDEVEFYTKEEFDRLIEQTMNNQTVYTIFMTFYWTGMRLGELRALTPNDIHIDEKYIDVNKSLQVVKGKEIITDPKTPKSKRKITIPDFWLLF